MKTKAAAQSAITPPEAARTIGRLIPEDSSTGVSGGAEPKVETAASAEFRSFTADMHDMPLA